MELRYKDFKFKSHGTWMPDDGFEYRYFSVLRQTYRLITSMERGPHGLSMSLYDHEGYASVHVPDMYESEMLFTAEPNPDATYETYGILLIKGERLPRDGSYARDDTPDDETGEG